VSGGPGQAASDFYLSIGPAFSRIRRDRDLVIVDQRGTGRSNRLDCALPDDSEFVVFDPHELQAAVRECLAILPGDPRYYTTSIAVRDLDDIRAALGYSTLNIYGISYGTRVAQHYMRRYPDRVRAAILDIAVEAEQGACEAVDPASNYGRARPNDARWRSAGRRGPPVELCGRNRLDIAAADSRGADTA
jgi:pimeloyl-ACP methyl ester carboxylesterase